MLAHREKTHLAAAQYEQARGAALRISDHVRGDLYSCRDAVSRRGDPDRESISRRRWPVRSAAWSPPPSGSAPAICRRACPRASKDDELSSLSRAFNRMTYQIQSQQRELLEANRATRRAAAFHRDGVDRRFGRGHRARSRRPGLSAEPLRLGSARDRSRPGDRRGSRRARAGNGRPARSRRRSARTGWRKARCRSPDSNSTRTLLVRIAAEHDDGEISGFVVTFDDITELLSAQRKAAWADIARRIAHEIKNPLTPIQLSAERLQTQIPEGHQERCRDLPDLHRHDHPACRGYRADGR